MKTTAGMLMFQRTRQARAQVSGPDLPRLEPCSFCGAAFMPAAFMLLFAGQLLLFLITNAERAQRCRKCSCLLGDIRPHVAAVAPIPRLDDRSFSSSYLDVSTFISVWSDQQSHADSALTCFEKHTLNDQPRRAAVSLASGWSLVWDLLGMNGWRKRNVNVM